jgi:hypothetical protein
MSVLLFFPGVWAVVCCSFRTKLIGIGELAFGLLFFTAGIVLLRGGCLLTFCIVYSVCVVCLPFVLFGLFACILCSVCLLFVLFVCSVCSRSMGLSRFI